MPEYFEVIDRNESEPAIPEGNSFDLPQLREIGGGGWGHVFKVEFNSPCALKLYDGRAGEGRLMESAKVEYQALVAMGGAGGHAPKAYAWGRALHYGVTRPAVIMEFVEGAPLADPRGRINPVLLEYGKAALGAEAALEAAERVAQALQACHEAGRVNRDLWPANVMVGYDEASRSVSSASIVDWGQAPRGDGHGVTPPDQNPRLAQLNFAAPEVYGGDHRDRRDGATVDVWSLGAIAFWLRTGKAPLGEELRGLRVTEDTMDEVAQIKRKHPLDLAAWLERYGEEAGPLDRGLSDLILRCTSYDPSRRPEGPGEVAGEIRGLLAPEVLEPTPGLKVPVHTPGLKVPEPTPGSFWSADVAVCDVRNVPAPSNVHTPVGPEAADAARQQAQWRRDAGAGYHRRIEQEQQTQEQAEHLGDMAELLERLGAQLREPQRREALRRLRDVLLAAGTEHMAPGLPDECRRGAEECESWLRRADEASDRCGRRAEGLRALAGQARGGRAPAGGGEGALEQAGGELEAGRALLRERPGRSSLGKLAREQAAWLDNQATALRDRRRDLIGLIDSKERIKTEIVNSEDDSLAQSLQALETAQQKSEEAAGKCDTQAEKLEEMRKRRLEGDQKSPLTKDEIKTTYSYNGGLNDTANKANYEFRTSISEINKANKEAASRLTRDLDESVREYESTLEQHKRKFEEIHEEFNCLKKIKKRLRSSEEDYFRSLRLEFNRLETKYINTMHMIKEYDEHKRVNYSTAQRKVEDIKENCNKYEKKYLSLKTEYDSLKKRFTEEYKKKKTFALYAGSILTALSQILLASPLSRVIRDRLHVAAALSFIVAVAILVFVCIVLAYIYIKMRYEIPNSHSSFLLKQPANTLFYHSVIGSLLGGGLITCASFILSIYN